MCTSPSIRMHLQPQKARRLRSAARSRPESDAWRRYTTRSPEEKKRAARTTRSVRRAPLSDCVTPPAGDYSDSTPSSSTVPSPRREAAPSTLPCVPSPRDRYSESSGPRPSLCSTFLDMSRTRSTLRASIENAVDACAKAAMRVPRYPSRAVRLDSETVRFQKARKSGRERDLGPSTSIDKLVETAGSQNRPATPPAVPTNHGTTCALLDFGFAVSQKYVPAPAPTMNVTNPTVARSA